MNLFEFIPLALTILFNRSGSFSTVIDKQRVNVTITDLGTNAKATGFSYTAAVAIARELLTSGTGGFNLKVGADVYEVVIT